MKDDSKPSLENHTDDELPNSKLIASKQVWAKDKRLITGKVQSKKERLPPGQRLVNNWPVLDLGVQPDIEKSHWRLAIDGHVDAPMLLDWEAYLALPQVEILSDIHCVTQWSLYDNLWQGVVTSQIIELVKPKPGTAHVLLYGFDGYTTNVTMESFAAADCLLAHQWNGQPIDREHGGPARLIIPRYYLWKSAKWVKRIRFSDRDVPGFWEERGYHNRGDPWLEERYSE